MSLIPRNNITTISDSPSPFTPFPQHFWDNFYSFPSFPFPFPSTSHTIPYSELEVETSGTVRTKLECKEVEGAHLIVAELPGVEKHEVDVAAEEGGVVTVSGGEGERGFSLRVRLPRDAGVGMLSWSVEDGVVTIVVPKVGAEYLMGDWDLGNNGRRNVREIEIQECD